MNKKLFAGLLIVLSVFAGLAVVGLTGSEVKAEETGAKKYYLGDCILGNVGTSPYIVYIGRYTTNYDGTYIGFTKVEIAFGYGAGPAVYDIWVRVTLNMPFKMCDENWVYVNGGVDFVELRKE